MIALHVAHYWPGGLVRWVTDFMAGDSEESYLLNWDGTKDIYGLKYLLHDRHGNVIETFSPQKQIIEKIDLESPELYEWVFYLVKKYKIGMMIVSTIFGYSLDLFKLPLKKLIIMHDFVYSCAGTFGYFHKPCEQCTNDDLQKCIASNPATNLFGGVSFEKFLQVKDTFMSFANEMIFVAPTEDTALRIRKIEPRFLNYPIAVIPHGLSTEFPDCFGGGEEGRKLRLVFLGRYLWYKGWPVFEKVLPDYADQIDFFILGCGEEGEKIASSWSRKIIPHYEQKNLPQLLLEIKPDVGLVFPLVPETYSYTLTELLHARIPVIAPRVGALQERVCPEFGFPVEPSERGLREELDRLLKNRKLLPAAHDVLMKQPRKTARQMSDEYRQLLEKITKGKNKLWKQQLIGAL